MTNKHIQKKWNQYFKSELNKGLSKEVIKKELIQKGLSEEYIDEKLKHYEIKEASKKVMYTAVLTIFLLFVLSSPFILKHPTITGAPVGVGGDIFYVDATNGNDANDGSSPAKAIKTIAKVNTLSLDPGDTVLFKRGEVWLEPHDAWLVTRSGSSSGYVVYGAYGSGNKPIFIGAILSNSTSDWIEVSNNLWRYTEPVNLNLDVGNLIMYNGDAFGWKNYSISSIVNYGQGGYYYNSSSTTLYLYSEENPVTYYGSFYMALGRSVIDLGEPKSYVIIENLSIMYGARHGIVGIDTNNIIIRNNDIHMIGGQGWGSEGKRLGNGIELWWRARNNLVEYNRIWDIWDDAMTDQTSDPRIAYNITYRYNVVWDSNSCYNSFDVVGSNVQNITLDHNTCYNIGNTWGDSQRYDTIAWACFRLGENPSGIKGLNISNNICYEVTKYVINLNANYIGWEGNSNLTLDYNYYYRDPSALGSRSQSYLTWDGVAYKNIETYKSASNKDKYSIQGTGEQIFVDAVNADFTPIQGSSICTMSSTGSYVGALPCAGGSSSVCGDGNCDGDESCSSCESDCGVCAPVCGDSVCEGNESCSSCVSDCGECEAPNTVPTHASPVLNASDYPVNSTSASLECYNISTADIDGDSVTNNYRWFKNSILEEGVDSEVIDSSFTEVGDVWICEVTPFDGEGYGVSRNSSPLTIRTAAPAVVCNNSVCESGENCSSCSADCGVCPLPNNGPTQGVPNLRASDYPLNSTNATLNCYNVSTADADNDSVINSYRWFRNNSLISGLYSNSVSQTSTSIGDSWKCEIKPFDGEDYGVARNSSVLTIRAVCNNSICELGENCSSCESDCGVCPVPDYNITGCTLEGKSWNEDSSLINAYNLSACFTDPLNTAMNYTAVGNSQIIVSIGSNGLVNLSAPADWNGNEYVIFRASSGSRFAFSNNVSLIIVAVPDCGDSICESGETCDSCEDDCGECPKSSGGGGGGARPVKVENVSENVSSNLFLEESNISEELEEIKSSSSKSSEKNNEKNKSDKEALESAGTESPLIIPITEEPKVVSNSRFAVAMRDLATIFKENIYTLIIISIILISGFAIKRKVNISALAKALTFPHKVEKQNEQKKKTDVKTEVHSMNLSPYIIGCLNMGYTYEAIKKSLETHSVTDEEIDSLFEELKRKGHVPRVAVKAAKANLSSEQRAKLQTGLSNAMKTQKESGFEEKDIKQMFINHGYPEDVVKKM